jgi:co-chaperonin GroES (HSP10)
MARYEIKKAEPTPEERAAKYEADAANSIDWQPPGRRLKIQPDPEAKSSVIITLDKTKEVFVRGTILAVGCVCGMNNDGTRRLEEYKVGQRILYNASHLVKYTGTDGIDHFFLKPDETQAVLAVEGNTTPKESN